MFSNRTAQILAVGLLSLSIVFPPEVSGSQIERRVVFQKS